MGNVWGTTGAIYRPSMGAPVGDVTLSAGVETNFITYGIAANPNPGNYYPLIWAIIAIAFGATAPTALTFAITVAGGADVDTMAVNPASMVINTTGVFFALLRGLESNTAWTFPGSILAITGLSATTACTVRQVGTRAMFWLPRGLDT